MHRRPLPSVHRCLSVVMKIRRYSSADARATAELFCDAVHRTCAADYTARELDAWAPRERDVAEWDASFEGHAAFVAEHEGAIIGFGDADVAGYLDRLYVHADHLRRGVATALCERLEAETAAAGATRIAVRVSVTARPFFLGRGYRVAEELAVVRRGERLTCYAMEKEL